MRAIRIALTLLLVSVSIAGTEVIADSPLLAETVPPPVKILFMRLAFPDEPAEPISESDARMMMGQVQQWYGEGSYGRMSIQSDITPLLLLPQTKDWYSQRALNQLLLDAREQAAIAGFDVAGYAYDIARHSPIPGWNFSGLSLAGQKGLWLQINHLGVLIHELGHNLGLPHANLWAAVSDSIIGPGTNVDYGNPVDPMATPLADPRCCEFNACFKYQLGWLTSGDIGTITTSRKVRLYAFDTPAKVSGRLYGIRIPKDEQRQYWLELRQKLAANSWSENGLWINWGPWPENRASTQLLDTTPGSGGGADDAPLVVGKTLADPLDSVFVTPLAIGYESSNRWMDVQINLGTYPSNRIPSLTLGSSAQAVSLNEPVQFIAEGSDPDGDALAYAWDFGDTTVGPNSNRITRAWSRPGRYVVRCVVSDMKGGTCGRFELIEVGSTNLLVAAGRILDSDGQPVGGVRVHNGAGGQDYRGTETDCEGRYILSNLTPGNIPLAAVKYGYKISPKFPENPLNLSADVANLDWLANANPLVTVTASDDTAAEPAGTNNLGVFTIERTGSLTNSLTVAFRMSGSAVLGQDYQLRALLLSTTVAITLPPGVAASNIVVRPTVDELVEKPETVILTLLEQDDYRLDVAKRAATVWINDLPNENNTNPVANEDVLTRFTYQIAQISVAKLLSNDSDPDGDSVVFVGVQSTSAFGSDVFAFDGIVYYVPRNDSPGEDTFVYTVADGRGGTANGVVRVVSLTPPPPRLQITTSGNLRQIAGSNGAPWQTYRLEASDTLSSPQWTTLTAVTNDSLGQFSILDLTPLASNARFYRTSSP